ncbi:MAG TPA: hypothetical protein VM030_03980 [Acidimicrobiales bacterium]|nr:hypothetical protein [Acidimicrobiales bacterium]
MSASAGGLASACAALLLLAACGSADGAEQPGAAVPVEDGAAITVPTEVAVAQRDVDALAHQYGEMARLIVAEGAPTAEFQARLEAAFVGTFRSDAIAFFGGQAAEGFRGWRRPPADPVTRVLSVSTWTSTCRKLRVTQSLTGFIPDAPADHDLGWMWLVPRPADAHNPTGWAVTADLPDSHVRDKEYC